MSLEKFAPRDIPFQASAPLREYLDDQMRRLQVLVNGAAQIEDDETISADWTFTGQINFGSDWSISLINDSLVFLDNDDDGQFQIRDINNFTNFQVDHSLDIVDVRNAFKLRIRDSADTDFGDFFHNGDDFKMEFTNTDDLHISGVDDVVLLGGVALRVDNVGDSAWCVQSHDGTDYNFDFTNTTRCNFATTVEVTGSLLVGNGGGNAYASLQDDGTNFIAQAGANTGVAAMSAAPIQALAMRVLSLGDDETGTFVLPLGRQGGLLFLTGTSTSNACTNEWAILYVDDAAAITEIATQAAVISTGGGANPDVDGDINVWSASAGTISVKNRRGGARRIQLVLMG